MLDLPRREYWSNFFLQIYVYILTAILQAASKTSHHCQHESDRRVPESILFCTRMPSVATTIIAPLQLMRFPYLGWFHRQRHILRMSTRVATPTSTSSLLPLVRILAPSASRHRVWPSRLHTMSMMRCSMVHHSSLPAGRSTQMDFRIHHSISLRFIPPSIMADFTSHIHSSTTMRLPSHRHPSGIDTALTAPTLSTSPCAVSHRRTLLASLAFRHPELHRGQISRTAVVAWPPQPVAPQVSLANYRTIVWPTILWRPFRTILALAWTRHRRSPQLPVRSALTGHTRSSVAPLQ